jgi:deoxyribonuclease NucA/NucB
MKTRASRYFRLAAVMAACVTATAATSLAAVPSALASAHTRSPGHAARVAAGRADPPVGRPVTFRGNCAKVRAHLAYDAAHGIRWVMCVMAAPAVKATGLPSLCRPNSQHFFRFTDCWSEPWELQIINSQTGQLVGTVTGSTTFWNALSYKSRFWNENIEVHVTGVTGKGAGSSFHAPIRCVDLNPIVGPNCQNTGSGSWRGQSGYLPVGKGDVYPGELGWESPGSATVEFEFKVVMKFHNPNTKPSNPLTLGPTRPVRCDSKIYFKPTSGGCAYPNATNLFKLSKSNQTITEAATFISDSQSAIPNHVGEYGVTGPVGPALTRTTDRSKIRRNRRVACKGVHPHKGQSCDEYPFASTNQGAALVPHGYYKSKAVNDAQNKRVGSLLSSFFLKQRIIDRDPFYVMITP